jgi:hypothetical protein
MAFDPRETARRAVLTSVGLGVIAFDRAAAQGRQAQARLDEQLAPVRSRVDERLAPARARVETLLKEARTEAETATETARQHLPESVTRLLDGGKDGDAKAPAPKIKAPSVASNAKPRSKPATGAPSDEPTPA